MGIEPLRTQRIIEPSTTQRWRGDHMAFVAKTRYGAEVSYSDEGQIPAVVEMLIRELETEQFDEPDDEHFQVAITYGDWAVTVTVFGHMILDDMSGLDEGIIEPELFKRAASRNEAIVTLSLIAEGKVDEVRSAGWLPRAQLSPYERA